jgi:hypothetical protein
MIIIKMQGGLGNQMFQYAFAQILAQKNNTNVVLDGSFFERVEKNPGFTPRTFELANFNNSYIWGSSSDFVFFHKISIINKFKKKTGLNYPKIYEELLFGFQADALSIKSPVYLKGYFQSYKYLIGYEDFVRQLFSFPIDGLDDFNNELLSTIKSLDTIAIHIRRGDYVNDTVTAAHHGRCSLDYYQEAIKLLVSKNEEFTFVFFSDDSDWVKRQFKDLAYSKIFVEHNKNEDSWKDMCLMSFCNHNIIANSSFSWWAAWLNQHSDKIVIAPKKWFVDAEINTNDLIPSEWIRL